MRSLNDFANGMSRSYATRANAERALEQATRSSTLTGSSLVHQRESDDRFVVIIINPDASSFHWYMAKGLGVFGLTQEGA
jgi:hypothetical protein